MIRRNASDRLCCRSSAWRVVIAGSGRVSSAHLVQESAVARQDLGGEQALHPRAVRQARRDGPGHPALHLVLAGAAWPRATRWRSLIGTPLGFLLGLSKLFTKSFDPIIQVLRPVSPLAWLPLGLVLFQKSEPGGALHHRDLRDVADGAQHRGRRARDPAGLPERREGAEAVADARRFFKILHPATLPYMFTGFRLSLGIAWLVIVAAEMLTGTPGVGGFLWQEYNSLIYEHIILCILTIGVVGFVLDRLMSAGRAPLQDGLRPWLSSSCEDVAQGLRRRRHARRGAARHQPRRSSSGEFVAIVGYSGAGKTTLLSLIAGLDRARHAARVTLRRQADHGPGPERGVVFQNYSLLPWLTVYENIAPRASTRSSRDWPRGEAARARRAATSRW